MIESGSNDGSDRSLTTQDYMALYTAVLGTASSTSLSYKNPSNGNSATAYLSGRGLTKWATTGGAASDNIDEAKGVWARVFRYSTAAGANAAMATVKNAVDAAAELQAALRTIGRKYFIGERRGVAGVGGGALGAAVHFGDRVCRKAVGVEGR